jgi:hypothetical protein
MTEHEDNDLDEIAARLETERPVPSAAFRGELRRRLLATQPRRLAERRRALALITSYATAGLLLLATAALGVLGVGPFAA